jgi:transcriptional regulator with XRE-family HTH domain
VRFQQVQKYETGANRIAASRLYRAAGALRVSVDWFFNHAPTPAIRATDGRPDCPYNGQRPVSELTAAGMRPTRRTGNA